MEHVQVVQHLSSISGIPASFYAGGDEIFHTPDIPYLQRIVIRAPQTLFSAESAANCLLTDELLCYGTVKINDTACHIIFGPVTIMACDNQRAQRILRASGLPTTEAGQLLSYLRSVPTCSYQRFANFIIFANYVLNNETIGIGELVEEYRLQDESLAAPVVEIDASTTHNAQAYERELFSMIRYGQYEKLLAFFAAATGYTGNEGMLAGSVQRHEKNLIIASTTMAARCAVQGGVDYETAMSLADAYIQKVELAPDAKSLAALNRNMMKTYTRMVWEKKQNNSETGLSSKVHAHVERNISERISTADIAQALGVSRSYLSSQFKQETGMELSAFIRNAKLDEARRLLETTDLPVIEIASRLSFSSQGHLHSLFKKHVGITPIEYRKKQVGLGTEVFINY